jgi:hypothetical protein
VKYLFLVLFLVCHSAWAQLVTSIDLNQKLVTSVETEAKEELLHQAVLKSYEKLIPEIGYKFDEFNDKLYANFNEYFTRYKEKKLIEKFGTGYEKTLSDDIKKTFAIELESDRHNSFIRFSKTKDVLRSHSFANLKQNDKDPLEWQTKVNLDIDKIKLDKFVRKIVTGETKPISKIILITEITPQAFSWKDLGLEEAANFTNPLDESWVKWINENLPSTVEEVVICDSSCMSYYNKWSETQLDEINVPEEYLNSVFLNVHLELKRSNVQENLKESTFEWEGRTLLQDVATKRILASFALPNEKRTFRQQDQKGLNSGIASSIYRTPLTAFMQFNRKLETKIGFNRVSRLVIQGYRHLGQVLELEEMLKTRGTSLGLDVFLDHFSKDEANLVCFYRGEEKSFTDLLSSIKELKSNHSYRLVNEFTGVHHLIKFVTE